MDLLETLAAMGDEHLDQLVKDARKLRAKKNKDKIPQALKDSLVTKHDRLEQGQTTAIIIKPELCFSFTVKRMRDYTELDWDVKLVNAGDAKAKAFFDLFDLSTFEVCDPEGQLPKLDPHLHSMMEQERHIRESWDDEYYNLQSTFGVNAWVLVEELKKGD